MKNILLLSLIAVLAGCGSLNTAGVYKGDKVLYTADLSITTSYDVIHGFVSWEYNNRVALASTPEIKAAADNMRKNAKSWIASAIACRDAYAAAPTDANNAALQKAIVVLQTAVAEATKYMLTSVK